jgi:hypothetical protein
VAGTARDQNCHVRLITPAQGRNATNRPAVFR